MPEQSSMHAYLNWAKERIDEMDAALASLEARESRVEADTKAKAAELLAELKTLRDRFTATAKKTAEAGEAAFRRAETEMASQLAQFEALVKTYFETVGRKLEAQEATFQKMADAQIKAWHEAADKLHAEAAKTAMAKRAEVDGAIRQMKADAERAEARLKKMQEAGRESWTALSGALAESRKAFDHANKQAWEAFAHAASAK